MRTLHAISFLAPNLEPVYRFTMDYLGRQLNCRIELTAGSNYADAYQADLTFICGLRTPPRRHLAPFEAAAAPVLRGERYQNRPIYFSDVIVRSDSPYQSFRDLRGCLWAYNEPESQSGYGITRYWLAQMGETGGYFGRVVEAGFHQTAIRMVFDGKVDAAAIDSQVLAVELRDHPELAARLRVIDSLGPSTIQPLAASTNLPAPMKSDIQAILSEMHTDAAARQWLDRGFIARFVAVQDSDYDDIRAMLAACERAAFLTLK